MKNVILQIEKGKELEKKLTKEIAILADSVSMYGNEIDETVKTWINKQENRILQLENRKETVKRLTQGLIKVGYEKGFDVARFSLRSKDVLGDSYEKGNKIVHNAVSLDKTSENGSSLADTVSSDETNEKGRKVKLGFDELKNLLQTSVSPAIWAKCFNVTDFLHFSKIAKEPSQLSKQRRFAIQMIIAETHNRTNELQILKARYIAASYSHALKMKNTRKAAA